MKSQSLVPGAHTGGGTGGRGATQRATCLTPPDRHQPTTVMVPSERRSVSALAPHDVAPAGSGSTVALVSPTRQRNPRVTPAVLRYSPTTCRSLLTSCEIPQSFGP